MPPAVLPEFRPTLPELLRARFGRRPTTTLLALSLLLAAATLAFALLRPGEEGTTVVQRTGPVQFNFRYPSPLTRVAPQGDQMLRLEARRSGLFLQSFAVAPLRLPAYRGEVGGALPVFATREIAGLRGRFAQFELVQDGKTRVNEVPGYAVLFRARLGKRRLFGRDILLPEPLPGARDGVRLLLLATPAAGVSSAADVGVRGVIKRPYRTFRFGTEPP